MIIITTNMFLGRLSNSIRNFRSFSVHKVFMIKIFQILNSLYIYWYFWKARHHIWFSNFPFDTHKASLSETHYHTKPYSLCLTFKSINKEVQIGNTQINYQIMATLRLSERIIFWAIRTCIPKWFCMCRINDWSICSSYSVLIFDSHFLFFRSHNGGKVNESDWIEMLTMEFLMRTM